MSDIAQHTSRATVESDVANLLKLMASALRNLKTYQINNSVLQKSVEMFYDALSAFLAENTSLTLLVRENDLMFGHSVVYSSFDKIESVAFALYKDGIRLLTFKEGLAQRELWDFLTAVHEARSADPYQADLVTILWEKDLANITYSAVDVYLEDEDRRGIEEIARKAEAAKRAQETVAPVAPNPEFFANELGFSPGGEDSHRRKEMPRVTEEASRGIVREILEEDDKDILLRCSDICLEVIRCTPRDDTFNRVVDFLGRICDVHVASARFLPACSILSDLRTLAGQDQVPRTRKASLTDTITKRSDRRKIQQIEEHLQTLSDSQVEEVFAYLALMSPTAVEPLCELLAESEQRKIRYLLCRAVSILARADLQRLRKYLNDPRWFFVRNIVMILGMMTNPEAVSLLKKTASHPEPRVRREVARSLGKIRHSSGLDLLKTLLGDANKMVRLAALAATRDIGDAKARKMLEDLIRDKGFGKRQTDEKTEAMKMYGNLGIEALPLLKSIAQGAVKSTDDKTRASAVYGLAATRAPEAFEILGNLVDKGSGAVRYAASEALSLWDTSMKVGGPREQ